MLKVGHVVLLLLRNIKFGHVVVLLFRMEVASVIVLLLRNVEGWSCSSLAVKKCWRLVM